MPDQSRANNNPDGTQESPMPSEEQKPIQDSQEDAPEQSETQTTEKNELPEEAKERTRREFEKLKASQEETRKELRAERSRREYLENAYKSFTTKKEEPPPIVDPDTGLINENSLTDLQRRTIEAENRAKRAEDSIRNYTQLQEERETFKDFPELDPKDITKFDRTLNRVTRSVLMDSMLHPEDYEGKQLSFKEAAGIAKGMSPKEVKEAEKRGAQQAMEGLTPKEQASLEATGMPNRRQDIESNIDDLRSRTRKGDLNAMIERMKRTG